MYVVKKRVFKWKEAGFKSYIAYHRAKQREYTRKWYRENRERHLENCREYKRRKREENSYKRWYAKTYLAVDNSSQKQRKSMV